MSLPLLDPDFKARQAAQDKPRWQQAQELALGGATVRKISFILDCDDREVCWLLGVAESMESRKRGLVKPPLTLAERYALVYPDYERRTWMRREMEQWQARQKGKRR